MHFSSPQRPLLPIDSEIPRIQHAVVDHDVVLLTATPGAGKTTRIPPALAHSGQKILVIEPRRVACVSSAQRIAEENQFQLGSEVGYEVRFDRKTNANTRITFMTDGLFLRKLQHDFDYDVIVLDEFHERTWNYDLILGLLKENLELGQKFKLILMSATFSQQKMLAYFASSNLKIIFVEVSGQVFPQQIEYQKHPLQLILNDQFHARLIHCLEHAFQKNAHSVLVFLPGTYEIDQAEKIIRSKHPTLLVHKLHGQLSLQSQKEVILFSSPQPRVILSTNLAESSLTIQDVDCVIDCGLQKVSEYRFQSGLSQLTTEKISLFSARQRAGRSARTKAGLVYRMWNQMDEKSFDLETKPQIVRSDLSEILLFLAAFGIQKPESFYWLDAPDIRRMQTASEQLKNRGLIDEYNKITARGRRVLQFPFDFDQSLLLLAAEQMRLGHLGALITAHLSGKLAAPIPDPERRSDLLPLLEHASLNQSQKQVYQQTLSLMQKSFEKHFTADDLTALLLTAWPHHLCRRRDAESEKAKHFSGMGAQLQRQSSARATEYLIAVSAHENQNEIAVRIAHGIEKEDVLKHLSHWMTVKKEVEMNADQLSFHIYQTKKIGQIEVDTQKAQAPWSDIQEQLQEDIANNFAAYLKVFTEKGIQDDFCHLVHLFHWISNSFSALPTVDEQMMRGLPIKHDKLKACLMSDHLIQFSKLLMSDETSVQTLFTKSWNAYFEIYLSQEFEVSPAQIQKLLQNFPPHFKTSRGLRKIQYTSDGPVTEARLQEFLGMKTHPCILQGRFPIKLILLGPHYRPVQTTSNLIAFWKSSYPDIRKELKGQYPKHAWPEDPTALISDDHSNTEAKNSKTHPRDKK